MQRSQETFVAPAWPVTVEIRPRFRDTDAMGHINNAVYVTYLEVARQEYWVKLGGVTDYRRVPFILANVACDFRSEALVHETLAVAIRCEWIGTRSFAFRYEIREASNRRLVVEASSVQVCYDYDQRVTFPVPDALRRQLETFEGRDLKRTASV
jgi:acyl-CoA thioester hydrolase